MTIDGYTIGAGLAAALSVFWHKLVKRWPAPYTGPQKLTIRQRFSRIYGALFDALQDEFGNNDRIGERSPAAAPPAVSAIPNESRGTPK